MGFIEQNKARPFFCYLPFNTPHSLFCVPDEYWNRFKDKPLAMHATDAAKEELNVTRCALAMCENIDWNVGRVLKKLDELKLSDNTIVIYFSDNGSNGHRWNGGMKGIKGSTDEGGVRAPFFIRWPAKIKPNKTVGEISSAIDLLPTLAKLADVSLAEAKPLDGKDISPLLLGSPGHWPDRMLFTHQAGKVSVRTQQYRLADNGTLYDMISDPDQKTNIAPQKPDIAKRLSQSAAAWRQEVLPAKSDDERPYPVGFAEFPMTPLPARDGVPHGHVRRSSRVPNSSYFVNWTSTEDPMTWDIGVQTAGEYDVSIFYTCPEGDTGSTIRLEFKGSGIEGKISRSWDPPLIENQDRVPRQAESYHKEFQPLKPGVMRLEKGRGLFTLHAVDVVGKQVADIQLVTLTLKYERQKLYFILLPTNSNATAL